MSIDLETGGDLVTAGLVAKQIDGDTARQSTAADQRHRCANCSGELVGSYCHRCGQAAHVHRSLLHMLEETLHGILHFDTKSWRTLPLLAVRPGLLTRRYLDGQRVKYVSPLALFLFSIFLMFFVVSQVKDLSPSFSGSTESSREETRAEFVADLNEANANVAKLTAELAQATDPSAREDLADQLSDAKSEQQTASKVLASFDAATAAKEVKKAAKESTKESVGESAQQAKAGADTADEVIGKILPGDAGKQSKVGSLIRHGLENPELTQYKLKNTAYKFSFMLIPISLPFLWLMFFWRRGFTLYDHAVFSLYSLSFMSFFFALLAIMSIIPRIGSYIATVATTVPPLHMFLQLRETYSLGIWSTLWRTFALLCIAGTVFILFLLMVVAITVH
jgi:hypothetical protein